MAASNVAYSVGAGQAIYGGMAAPVAWTAAYQLNANAACTLYSSPQAVYRNGATYIGWVNNQGDVGITKKTHATGVLENFALHPDFEINGHDNATITFLQDGRILCMYCKHNDDVGMRYRISLFSEDISAWEVEQVLPVSTLPNGVSYNSVYYLPAVNKYYMHYRAGDRSQRMRATQDGVTWDADRPLFDTNGRPYVRGTVNGANRIDFVYSNGHPNEMVNHIFHCYMLVDAQGVESFYTSNGAYISGGAVTHRQGTEIYNGGSADAWNTDIIIGKDGHPRVLFTQYVVPGTDHRHMFSRWTGTAWTTAVEIAPTGGKIDDQTWSDGQCCFDQFDPDIVYLSTRVGEYNELQAWRTSDNGATWFKERDVTSGSAGQNVSPMSPRGAMKPSVTWLLGTGSNYLSFVTSFWGAGV